MKGSPKIIEALNKSLEGELYAIMQYILHSESCEDLGYGKLAGFLTKESRQEMHHAERLVERIIFLEGTPKMKMNREITFHKDMKKNLQDQLDAEIEGIEQYRQGIKISREVEDAGTRQLLEEIIKDEEDHVDWIEAQQDLIANVGMENYLAQQIYSDAE
ncbi:MAG: bacterioferritin [Calditrichia bacterium]